MFRGDIVYGKCKDRFKSYLQRVISTDTTTTPATSANIQILSIDCTKELSQGLLGQIPQFKGSEFAFLDLPKVGNICCWN